MYHLSVLWHIIPLKCSNWNITVYSLDKKSPSMHNFSLLSAPMKVHPIPYAIFETTRPGFIQILHHCSVSWKITLVFLLAQTSYTLNKNSPSKWNFWTFQWLGRLKFTKFLMSYLKSQVSFSLNFASLFSVMRDNSSVLF